MVVYVVSCCIFGVFAVSTDSRFATNQLVLVPVLVLVLVLVPVPVLYLAWTVHKSAQPWPVQTPPAFVQ